MSKAIVFLAPGFEEIEATTIIDILRRGEVIVEVVSITKKEVKGAHDLKFIADKNIKEINQKDYDAIILPGGSPGYINLRNHTKVLSIIMEAFEKNKLIGAICAAPAVLAKSGILKGKKCTIYPGMENELKKGGGIPQKAWIVEDKNIITSQGPATALPFALKLVEKLSNPQIAETLAIRTLAESVLKQNKIQIETKIEVPISNSESAITIQNLFKQFEDVIAVDGLNLQIRKGELFGLLGPNGAGKSTTINILSGLLQPTKGKAQIGGFDVSKNQDEIKKLIGLCPQKASVFNFLTGRENIELFGRLHSISKNKLEQRIEKFLTKLDLKEDSNRQTKSYSGGMLRKLNLIIALINDPQIAFLDEPTVGMDPRARRATWDFIKSLKNKDKTIILTTHYIEEAESLSDRVGIIDYGKLIELGSPKELMKKYKTKNLEEVFLKITGRRILEGV
jgi:ABC-2 type transport system ATP-binding protein